MGLFVVIGHDGPDGTALRDKNREAHVAHIDALDKAGRIQFAGPIKSDDGAVSTGVVILVEAADLEEARKITYQDPYVTAGVYSVLTVAPVRKVFPKGA